jgi:glucosamine--fructose-6-phosphate aminotransferase (isomerizing)
MEIPMHTHTRMMFQRQHTPFGLLQPPQAQLSNGPHAKPGTRPRVAVVHRGHIHNHTALRSQLQDRGYHFSTNNDGELIAHLIDAVHPGDALQAVRRATALLQGHGAFAVQFHDQAHRLLATRMGPSVALRLHPLRVELIEPAPLPSSSPCDPTGLYLLPEGEVLDIQTAT